MDANEVLKKAWEAVESSGVPEPLQEVAFKSAVDLISGGVRSYPASSLPKQPNAFSSQATSSEPQGPTAPVSENEVIQKISDETGLDVERLTETFFYVNEQLGLNIKARMLGKTKAEQSRNVIVLMTAAYHYGLDHPQTPADLIRSECDRLKVLDTKNFATIAAAVPGVAYTGPRGQKAFKVKNDAIEQLRIALAATRPGGSESE